MILTETSRAVALFVVCLFVDVGLQICQKVTSSSLRHMYIHTQCLSTRTRRDTQSKLPLLESLAHNYKKYDTSEVTHLTLLVYLTY